MAQYIRRDPPARGGKWIPRELAGMGCQGNRVSAYIERDPPAQGGKWTARPLSGMGFDPVTASFIVGGAKETGVFSIFGPSEEFMKRQDVRDQYQEIADNIRMMAPTLPAHLKPIVISYLPHISSVIARGATASDLSEIKAKATQWQTMLTQGPPTGLLPTVPGVKAAMAGLPWYVWVIGLGILLPKILKR